MKYTFIDSYERHFDEKDVLKSIRMPADHPFGESIAALLAKTDQIASPKAFYMESVVEKIENGVVTVDGHAFHSPILCKKLKDCKIVYPYLSTCGKELADYGLELTDMMDKFAFDAVMEFYRRQIDAAVKGAIENLLPEKTVVSTSNPGSLIDWHIREQRTLFNLFGEAGEKSGVVLNENYLMFPVKSVAGIAFGGSGVSHDCELCQKENCPGRKAPFSMKAYLAAKDEEM
ncbi:MAG: hypothetical protein ACOX8R_04035 [Bacillota bacterium]|jgi:hypothetical protein